MQNPKLLHLSLNTSKA